MLNQTPHLVSAGVSTVSRAEPSFHSRRTYADIRALDRALVAEDLPAAREAFHRLQEDSPLIAAALSHDPFPARTRPLQALRMLGRCLLRGDMPGARRAFELFC